MTSPRRRLDVCLVDQGLAESRERAQALIMAGQVTINGQQAQKAGQAVPHGALLAVIQPEPYVSRGGYKLAHALDTFRLNVAGLVAADVGASTGGFTDVLLQRGAARVYAIDVGRGQLHWRLRSDPRVVSLDRTNARNLQSLPEAPGLATLDLAFISLRLVLPPIHRLLLPNSSIIALVKPQFEAGPRDVERGGVVRSLAVHRRVLAELAEWLPSEKLALRGLTASPIRGPAGNAEFLAWLGTEYHRGEDAESLIARALAEVHAPEQEKEVSPGSCR